MPRKKKVVQMKKGDLVFIRSKSIVGWLIRLVSTGRFKSLAPNHVAIIYDVVPDGVILIEATSVGVRLVDMKRYKNCKIWIKRMKEPRNVTLGLTWAYTMLGLKYDYRALIGIFARSLVRILGKRIYTKIKKFRNLLDTKMAFFCSEFVETYAMKTGKRLWIAHTSETTPWDLIRSDELQDIIAFDHRK